MKKAQTMLAALMASALLEGQSQYTNDLSIDNISVLGYVIPAAHPVKRCHRADHDEKVADSS